MDQKCGNIVIYRPSREEDKIYEYQEEYQVEEIVYQGNELRNVKNLEIGNQGGILIFRICNNALRKALFE